MLSFAANYYFTAWITADKLTNLVVHLLNGAVLYGLLLIYSRSGANAGRNR